MERFQQHRSVDCSRTDHGGKLQMAVDKSLSTLCVRACVCVYVCVCV